MNVLIENYRGWEISFNPDEETFICASNVEDKQEKKKSFASCKKSVDDFIKENSVFKPVTIIGDVNKYKGGDIITLTGIRKDKRFTYLDSKGVQKQLFEYDEKCYVIYDSEKHDKIISERNILKKQIAEIECKKQKLDKTFTGIPLSEIKAKYTI